VVKSWGTTGEEVKEALRLATERQSELSRARFEMETRRGKTVELLAGGALTVSFPIVFGLTEHGRALPLGWVIAAWTAWVLTLINSLVASTVGIHVYGEAIRRLAQGEWEAAQSEPPLAKWIEPLNLIVMSLLIAGFILFSIFAVRVLEDRAIPPRIVIAPVADAPAPDCGTRSGMCY
jgi:hypothetical protein